MASLGTVSSHYGITFTLDEPLYVGGSGISSLVPGMFQVSLAGHAYNVDTQYEAFRRESFRSQSIAPIADKSDITNIPGEASVNTESLWRREMQDWSDGSGQLFLDRRASQSNRFKSSKGIYPWTQNYASLLNATTAVHASGGELQVLVVGSYVYINDAGTVRYATGNLSSWSAVAGVTAALTSNALATDGNNVYIAAGSGSTAGIYLITTPGSTAASWITGATINYVWYAGDQLLAAGTNILYSIWVGTGTAGPTAIASAGSAGGTAVLLTHRNAKFVWSSAAAGNSWIYVGGATSNTSANFSLIYKVQVSSTGLVLTVPVTAATLPGGELVYSLFAYANFILVGTSLGARFCETLGINDPGGNQGDLKMGPIVPDQIQQVTKPVRCFTGQFRWVWFGWSNYDATSTGLGRMDLSTFIDQQAPAYTSDLMVSATGSVEVTSMDWYNGLNNVAGVNTGSPIFVVANSGVYTAASTFVPQGVIDTGYITFGLPDNKVGLQFDFNGSGTGGTIGATITVDDNAVGAYMVGAQSVTNSLYKTSLPTLRGEMFDVQIQLNSGSSNTVSPTLRRFQIKALPAVVSGTQHIVPLDCAFMVEGQGLDYAVNPYSEWQFLDALRQSATPITYQEGSQFQVQCVIKEVDWVRYTRSPGSEGGFNTVIVVFLASLEN